MFFGAFWSTCTVHCICEIGFITGYCQPVHMLDLNIFTDFLNWMITIHNWNDLTFFYTTTQRPPPPPKHTHTPKATVLAYSWRLVKLTIFSYSCCLFQEKIRGKECFFHNTWRTERNLMFLNCPIQFFIFPNKSRFFFVVYILKEK
jgi:hypothetical protein